jgi:hypothetical protein
MTDVFSDLRCMYDRNDVAGWLIRHKYCNPAAWPAVTVHEIPDDIRVWEMLTSIERRAQCLFVIRIKNTPETLMPYLPTADAFIYGDDGLLQETPQPPYTVAVPNIHEALQVFPHAHAKAYLDTGAARAWVFDGEGIRHLATVVKKRHSEPKTLVADCPLVHTHVFAHRAGVFASAGAVFAMKAMVTLPFVDGLVKAADVRKAVGSGYIVSGASSESADDSGDAGDVRLAVARSLARPSLTVFPRVVMQGALGPFQGKVVDERLEVFLTAETLQQFIHFLPAWLADGAREHLPSGFTASAVLRMPYTVSTNVCRDIPEVLQSMLLHEVQITDIGEATAWHVSVVCS